MVLKEFLGLTNLSEAQILYIHEITKVVVICEDKHLVFIAFQVVALCFKSFDNSQKLTIIDFVLSLYKNQFFRKKSY